MYLAGIANLYFGRKVLNQQGQILYIDNVQLMHFVKMSATDVTVERNCRVDNILALTRAK